MNILYLHQHFALRSGSTGTRSYEFARLLSERGHQVTVLCGYNHLSGLPENKQQRVSEFAMEGIHIVQLDVAYRQEMGFVRRLLAFAQFMLLASWVAARRPGTDVIYATSTPLTIVIPAMVASIFRRRPFVFEVRDLWPEIPIALGVLRNPLLIWTARLLERMAYRRAAHIVALSPGMKEGIVRQGIPAGKVSVIPNASDLSLFSRPAAEGRAFRAAHNLENRRLVVYTGSMGMIHGVNYLVRLAKEMLCRDETIAFLLVGSGSHKAAALALASESGVAGRNLFFLDPLPKAEMPVVLTAADMATVTVIDNPVLWHNSANKFFDALAAGRPVMINYQGWQADLLTETGAGLVLDAHDLARAADDLCRALQDETWLANAGRAARQLAEDRFDRHKLVDQLEAILSTAAAKAAT